MVLLYRFTGEQRYLDFCKYIFRAWEQPNGPKVISTLLTAKRVDKVGNGKAYEMLSCLNGALEYYRTSGDREILQACLNAWQDIVDHRLYVTGAASYKEVFHDDYDLPNVAEVGETCVTVTWLQFNAQLLRLTGEARFAEQLEHVVLNQLFGAQRCDGAAWGYYVEMQGKKPYSSKLDGHCCLSSGPRGVALIPTFAVTTDSDGIVVNLFDSGSARLNLRSAKDGRASSSRESAVHLTVNTLYPSDGHIQLHVDSSSKTEFALKLRLPASCSGASISVNGKPVAVEPGPDGYVALRRQWSKGDAVELQVKLEPRVIAGDHLNDGKVALMYGPLVLAADAALLIPSDLDLEAVSIPGKDLGTLHIKPEPAPEKLKTWTGAEVFRVDALTKTNVGALKAGDPVELRLVPFADAGENGTLYKVWLPLAQQN